MSGRVSVMRVGVHVWLGAVAGVGKELQGPVKDAAGCDQPVGRGAEHVRATSEDDDLEASVMLQVHVHRRMHLLTELVLHLRQPLGEISHVVVVDDGECADRLHRSLNDAADDFGAREVAQDGRSSAPTLSNDLVELLEEPPIHRNAESVQFRAHGRGV
jgi:hypothetical protein